MVTSIDQLDENKKYSYADYLTWKFDGYVELLRGKLSKMEAPTSDHQRLVGRMNTLLDNYLGDSPCRVFISPFDVRLFDHKKSTADKDIFTVVQPDVCVICDENKVDKKGCLGSPDLIVEILSPSTKKKDVEDKFELYEYNGVREYWIVSIEDETILVFDLDESGSYKFRKLYGDNEGNIHSNAIEDFSFKLERLFSAKR
jgi:Uma2 family endonuclease